MPEIVRFYGIIIKMFFKPKEHEPSHIHAIYNEYVGLFNIKTFEMFEGDLPMKAQELVKEWLTQHSAELQEMWDKQNNHKVTSTMIPRINKLTVLDNYVLYVEFDDGYKVTYNVMDDIETLPVFRALLNVHGLFKQAQLDTSRTCVYWNDEIDLASDSIYEFGKAA